MKYGVLGTGMVGLAISNRLAELGHEVMIGTRDPSRSREKLKSLQDTVKAGTFAQAAAFGEILFNVTGGAVSLEALRMAGQANMKDKVLVDISNPLDFSKGMPPSLLVSNTDSLGEQIQRAFPDAHVVKTLNTVNAFVMVEPSRVPGEHVIFLSGDDPGAKETVKGVLKGFGWSEAGILDLGGIRTARSAEMYLPLWLSLWGVTGTGDFNIGVNRG